MSYMRPLTFKTGGRGVAVCLIQYFMDLVYAPNRGKVSEVFGMFSEMDSMKMEKERRIEIPREIFSPWSGGDRNVTSVSEDSMTHGKMRFNVKKRCRRTRWNDAATCRIKQHTSVAIRCTFLAPKKLIWQAST